MYEEFLKKSVHESWYNVLLPVIESPQFQKILEFLGARKHNNKMFTPEIGNIFSAFKYCIFDNWRITMIGQDPYPQKGIATGIAFANKISSKDFMSPSLQIIMEELTESIPGFNEYNFINSCDLMHWAEQGILLLNSSFTVDLNNPNSHKDTWKPFTDLLLKTISVAKQPIVYVFMGAVAKSFIHNIEPGNEILTVYHPAADTHGNIRAFRGSGIFLDIDQAIDKNNLGPMVNWEKSNIQIITKVN